MDKDFVVYDILYYIHLTDFSQWIEKWTLTPSTFSNCIAPISLFLGKNMEYQFSLFSETALKSLKYVYWPGFFPASETCIRKMKILQWLWWNMSGLHPK